ncbi:MAG: hypothetical protein HDT22_00260 [Ruminococcus sp.]|nr:hypothetical protein [Ruminococcus sp.]
MFIFSSLLFSIVAAVAIGVVAGTLIAYVIILTVKWLRNKIKEKLAKRNVSKVATGDLEQMIKNCENQTSVKELDNLVDAGYSHVMAEVDDNGKVENVEVIKDTSNEIDQNVKQFINRTGEGMVVVSA